MATVMRTLTLLAVAFLLIAAGCGGGGEPSSPSPAQSASSPETSEADTLREYIAALSAPMQSPEAKKITEAASESAAAVDPDDPSTWPAYHDALSDYAELVSDYGTELKSVDPPKQLKESHKRLIASAGATAEVFSYIANRVAEGDVDVLTGETPPSDIADQASSMQTDMAAFMEAVRAEAERLGVELPEELPFQLVR